MFRIFFGIIFALAVAELIFSIDTYAYLEKQHKWWSFTEKARMGFLIFSCARTIFLSALYAVAHCKRVKNLMSTMHTVGRSQPFRPYPAFSITPRRDLRLDQIFLVISTILWVVSGILIHQMWGYVECANTGIADNFAEFKSQIEGGLSLCHEVKIIEIIAWVIAGLSVLGTIPVVKEYVQRRKSRAQSRRTGGTKRGASNL